MLILLGTELSDIRLASSWTPGSECDPSQALNLQNNTYRRRENIQNVRFTWKFGVNSKIKVQSKKIELFLFKHDTQNQGILLVVLFLVRCFSPILASFLRISSADWCVSLNKVGVLIRFAGRTQTPLQSAKPHGRAKRQVRGVKESPKWVRSSLSNRLNMFDSAIESLTRVDSNALFRF